LIIDLPHDQSGVLGVESTHAVRMSIWWTLCKVIHASRLNGHKVENRVNGTPMRQKDGLLYQTSISLFVDDVECVLRDLYGDVETDDLNEISSTIRTIVEEFIRYTRRDLSEEYGNAQAYDYCVGIGVPEGYGISGSESARGRAALSDLMKRSRAVLENRSVFSQYTVKFATYCDEHFYAPGEVRDDDLPF
jgi:hypothetical protein